MRFTHHAKLLALGAALAGLVVVPSVGEVSTATSEPSCGPINADGFHEISTADQMRSIIGGTGCGVDKNYILMDHIDLSGSWIPVGNLEEPENAFTGVFDGNGKTVSGLEPDGSGRDWLGLFGVIGSDGVVKNLVLTEVTIASDRTDSQLGTLAGANYGTVSNVRVQGTVKSSSSLAAAGGLVGVNKGTIEHASANVSVENSGPTGGLVGLADSGSEITDSRADGEVKAELSSVDLAGGLVGEAEKSATILRSFATGFVTGHTAGGLVGKAVEATIEESFARGLVSASVRGGGLLGRGINRTIENSYAFGNVTATTGVDPPLGGLVGTWEGGSIFSSYSLGLVSPGSPGNNAGGLVGTGSGSASAAFWNTSPSDQVSGSSFLGVGKTEAELQQFSTFNDAVWSIVDGWDTERNDKVWGISSGLNGGYPFLLWQFSCGPVVGGTHHVSTETQLRQIGFGGESGTCGFDAHYTLAADIVLLQSWQPLGSVVAPINDVFTGHLNGNNKTITGLRAGGKNSGTVRLGLFATVEHGAIITNLTLREVDIDYEDSSGGSSEIGGVAGRNLGTITNVSVSGTLRGDGEGIRVGGLVGFSLGPISNSTANVDVLGNTNVGGLVGYLSGTTITNSNSQGNVEGVNDEPEKIGGLVGWALDSQITASVATGDVLGRDDTGGLVGYASETTITDSLAFGAVTGRNSVGGLVGYGVGATITDGRAEGAVTGNNRVGGLVGQLGNGSSITGGEATGAVRAPATGTSNVNHARIGGLVGQASADTSITDSASQSSVTIRTSGNVDKVGGFVGESSADIHHSSASGNVDSIANGSSSTGLRVGGFVGENSGVIHRCSAVGHVHNFANAIAGRTGGLVGENKVDGHITDSFFDGEVFVEGTDQANRVGGFAGQNWGNISRSYGISSVTAVSRFLATGVGGFAGVNQGGTVSNSYSSSEMVIDPGGGFRAGFIAEQVSSAEIRNSFSISSLGASSSSGGTAGFVRSSGGGVNVIEASFWDSNEWNGQVNPLGTGTTTEKLQTLSTFTVAGWDIAGCVSGGTAPIWGFVPNSYPFLTWQDDPQLPLCPTNVGPSTQTTSPSPQAQTLIPEATTPPAGARFGASTTSPSDNDAGPNLDEQEALTLTPEQPGEPDTSTGDTTRGDTSSGGVDSDTDVAATPQAGANMGWLLGIALGGLAAIALISGGVMFARTRL